MGDTSQHVATTSWIASLKVGDKLQARCSSGRMQTAKVVEIDSRKKATPVKVSFDGRRASEDTWLGIRDLQSKKVSLWCRRGSAIAAADMNTRQMAQGIMQAWSHGTDWPAPEMDRQAMMQVIVHAWSHATAQRHTLRLLQKELALESDLEEHEAWAAVTAAMAARDGGMTKQYVNVRLLDLYRLAHLNDLCATSGIRSSPSASEDPVEPARSADVHHVGASELEASSSYPSAAAIQRFEARYASSMLPTAAGHTPDGASSFGSAESQTSFGSAASQTTFGSAGSQVWSSSRSHPPLGSLTSLEARVQGHLRAQQTVADELRAEFFEARKDLSEASANKDVRALTTAIEEYEYVAKELGHTEEDVELKAARSRLAALKQKLKRECDRGYHEKSEELIKLKGEWCFGVEVPVHRCMREGCEIFLDSTGKPLANSYAEKAAKFFAGKLDETVEAARPDPPTHILPPTRPDIPQS